MDGISTLAFGFGVDFSPLVIDAAMTVPWDGTNKPGGGYEVSVNYKFGAPSFSGNFVGQAAAAASNLTSDIARLTQQKKDLESQAQAAATNNQILKGDADVLQKRIGELKDEYRQMSRKKDVLSYELEQSKLQIQALMPKPAPPPPKKRAPAPHWPKTHAVQEGDTLRSLAQRYYGDPDLWEEIYRANESKFNQGLPVPGAVLTIPAPRQGE
ncbi:MAG: LysM peptidoglycan-binding domain-containing protein [Elusimicrobia bacterium]|nr:LysM peptidoglycan-binding domain-containing protein [Elusimicrobiota bacterium]